MITLVDTSVWVDHLRNGNRQLVLMLDEGAVCCHPFVVGELACGSLRNRDELLGLLRALPEAPIVEHDEVLHFIAKRHLAGRGLGWVDVHLLASALLAQCDVWTLDRGLAAVVREMKDFHHPG